MQTPNVLPSAETERLIAATQRSAAATLAAALIAASGRPHSTGEAIKLLYDIEFSLYPMNGRGIYEEWKKTHDPDLAHR
ncbi:MAG: hypothetical protein ACYCZR_15195 [Burkholderiales bacterium]